MTTSPDLAARRGALRLLDGVLTHGRMLGELTSGDALALKGLNAADRARAQRLALAVLRHAEAADRLLGPHLRKRPPLAVMNALRLALIEVAVLDEAPHGAVSSAVGLVRGDRKAARMAGLVNAVLRKAVEEAPARWPDLPPPRLPQWLRKPVEAAWGDAVLHAIEIAHQGVPPLDLTPGPRMTDEIRAELGAVILPTGSLRLTRPAQVSTLPGYEAGAWWVQDAAAAIPARVLGPRAGERVLDLCAAPGGKTMQLAAAGADVTALDVSEARLEVLRQNLARTGLAAEVVAADALTWEPPAPFDAILLDAPCTATGTIRRHPDLPHVKDGAEVPALVALQARLLDRAAGWLRPGGRLVYAVCSLHPAEGEAQARAALQRLPLLPDPAALDLPGIDPGWRDGATLRLRPDLWPSLGGMDGFFVSAFRRD